MIKIKLEKFEGPLSLLLKLIEKEEMDITEVSLAGVADQFVNYIRESDNINPEEMADFLVVAARLLWIKSKALLPYLFPDEAEEMGDLEEQLRMYKEFLEAASKIEKMLGKKKFMYAREFNRKIVLAGANMFSPPAKLQKEDLALVFSELLTRIRPVEKLEEEILDHKISIEDKIASIKSLVMEKIKISFTKFLSTAKNKTEVVVSFLAVLEMMRQREVVLVQEELFAEIFIERL